jgi:uncharacterized OB-fold protein
VNPIMLNASRDEATGQTYVPPRALAADGSLRATVQIQVPAQGVLYAATSFQGEHYGIVDLDCGSRIQTLLAPGTDRIGARVKAASIDQGYARFEHE